MVEEDLSPALIMPRSCTDATGTQAMQPCMQRWTRCLVMLLHGGMVKSSSQCFLNRAHSSDPRCFCFLLRSSRIVPFL